MVLTFRRSFGSFLLCATFVPGIATLARDEMAARWALSMGSPTEDTMANVIFVIGRVALSVLRELLGTTHVTFLTAMGGDDGITALAIPGRDLRATVTLSVLNVLRTTTRRLRRRFLFGAAQITLMVAAVSLHMNDSVTVALAILSCRGVCAVTAVIVLRARGALVHLDFGIVLLLLLLCCLRNGFLLCAANIAFLFASVGTGRDDGIASSGAILSCRGIRTFARVVVLGLRLTSVKANALGMLLVLRVVLRLQLGTAQIPFVSAGVGFGVHNGITASLAILRC